MVKWLEMKTADLRSRVQTIEVKGTELLSQLDKSSNFDIRFQPEGSEAEITYNLQNLFAPLGRAGRTVYKEKNFDALSNFLRTYWSYKGEPKVAFDIVSADTDEGFAYLTLRNSVVREDETLITLQDFVNKIDLNIVQEKLNRLVLGGDGSHIELQFLAMGNRKEVAAGDFLDPGIFVRLNGRIEVSPGVNRLVCTNGLVSRMNLWEAGNVNFLNDKDMIDRSIQLLDWLINKSTVKVKSVREISAALGDTYRKTLLNRFWKGWSERIDLKELTWYEVIANLTQSVNDRSLGNERYKMLEITNCLTKFDKESCCPTCSAAIVQ